MTDLIANGESGSSVRAKLNALPVNANSESIVGNSASPVAADPDKYLTKITSDGSADTQIITLGLPSSPETKIGERKVIFFDVQTDPDDQIRLDTTNIVGTDVPVIGANSNLFRLDTAHDFIILSLATPTLWRWEGTVSTIDGTVADVTMPAYNIAATPGSTQGSGLNIRAGDGNAGNGGSAQIVAGYGATADGGQVVLQAGGGDVNGGAVLLHGANGAVDGGSVVLSGGIGVAGNGGDVTLQVGSGAVANGNIIAPLLPTSDPMVANGLWLNNGVLCISGITGISGTFGATDTVTVTNGIITGIA